MSLALTVNLLGDSSNLTRNTERAKKSLTSFEKAAMYASKRINRTLGTVGGYLAFRNVIRFSIESAKAAGEDLRGQKLLADQLKRTAGAKAADITATEAMISRMELATGVADDVLRPAMVKLVTVTRNTKKAQDLLKLALGASAKTGKPVEQTATAIAKAYAGQTTSLFRLLPNLKQSKDWMKDLATETQGLAKQQADPFEKFNRAMDRIKEVVGLPILEKFGGLVSSFNEADWATINTAIQGIATGISTFFSALGSGDSKLGVLRAIQTIAVTIQANLQAAAGFAAMLTGTKIAIDPNSPLGQSFTMLGYRINKNNIWTPGGNNIDFSNMQRFRGAGQPGSASNPGVTYNIYGRGMTGKEIVEELKKVGGNRGIPYIGGR